MTVGSGPLFFAIPVSTGVTEVEHRHKVAPVWFAAIFLFMQGGPLAIIKENRHVDGYLCGHFESEVPELPWQLIACKPITNHGNDLTTFDFIQAVLILLACWRTSDNDLILIFSVFIDTLLDIKSP